MENIENQLFNKEFRESLQEINNDIAKLNQEFKLQSEQMQHTATEAGKLEQSINKLAKEKENVHKKIELTQQQLAKTKTLYGGNSEEAQKLGLELLNLQISEQNLENAIKQNSDTLRKQGEDMLNSSISAQSYTERLANASNILSGSLGQSSAAWKENSALSQVAGQQYALTEVQLEGMRDQIADIAISLSDALVPTIMNAIEATIPFIGKIEEGAIAFSGMDEEQGNSISKMGGLVAAVGPAMSGLADFITIVDGGGSIVAKLSEFLGGNKGSLIARLGSLGPLGVAGLAIAGLSAVGVAVYNLFKDKSELNEVSTEYAERLWDEALSLEGLADEYDGLREKSTLTTEQLGQLVDIQSEINRTVDPEKLKQLEERYENLAKHSGLTTDELSDLIELNGDIVSQSPQVEEAYTRQGNAIIDNTDAVRDYIAFQRDMALEDLSIERHLALENEAALLKEKKDLGEEILHVDREILNLNEVLNMTEEERKNRIDQIHIEKKKHLPMSEERLHLEEELTMLTQFEEEKTREIYDNLLMQKEELQNKKVLNDEELKKIDELNVMYGDMLLESVGINNEKGNGLELLDQEIESLKISKQDLEDKTDASEKNNEEYQKAVDKLDEEIEKRQEVKQELYDELGLKSEKTKKEEAYNRYLEEEKQHLEDISHGMGNQTEQQEKTNEKVRSGIGLAEDLQDELRKDANKNVDVKDHGTVAEINRRLKESITKQIFLRTTMLGGSAAARAIYGSAKGTNHHPGGQSLLGEEGPELVKQGREWFLAHFGLFDLKRGAKVFTAEQTQRMLAKGEAVNGYADGIGNNMIGLLPLQGNNESISNSLVEKVQYFNPKIKIEAGDVIIDGMTLGKVIWKPVKENIDRDNELKESFRG